MRTNEETQVTVNPAEMLTEAKQIFDGGNYTEALHMFNMVLLLEHNNVEAKLKRAACYMYLGKLKTAKNILIPVLQKGTHKADTYFYLAELYKINMNYDVALTFAIKALELDEQNANYLLMAAELCYLQKEYDEAFLIINKAIVASSFKKELYYWRALIFIKFDKPQMAISDLNKGIAINEHYADAYRLRGHCKMLLGKIDQYLADLKIAQHLSVPEANAKWAA